MWPYKACFSFFYFYLHQGGHVFTFVSPLIGLSAGLHMNFRMYFNYSVSGLNLFRRNQKTKKKMILDLAFLISSFCKCKVGQGSQCVGSQIWNPHYREDWHQVQLW